MAEFDDENNIMSGLRDQANKLKYDRPRVKKIVDSAHEKSKKHKTFLQTYKEDFTTLFLMLKAFVSGRYKGVPWSSVAYAVVGLTYFLNPFDVIPDFFLGIGLVDDAAVLALVLKALKKDLKKFRHWEMQQQPVRRG